jgi:peptidyl-dipeptidase Dcp
MPAEIALRHRPTQFGHIFSGDHYASGYYSYMWSEVMDADAFGAVRGGRRHLRSRHRKALHDDIYSVRRLARPRRKPMSRSAAGSRSPTRCCAAAGLLQTPEAA